jgi:putative colanic acid biosynthesis acetyltransferase WcaF
MNKLKKIDLSQYRRTSGRKEQFARLIWTVVWTVFARPVPRSFLNGWKVFLLRCFGAKIHRTATVYSGAKIYAPWNLEMDAYSCIATGVDCYCADKIIIGAHSVISQNVSIYTASHDIKSSQYTWISAPVVIKNQVWIAAECFIMQGVTVGEGAVVGARAAVFKDVEPWTVVGGNPAKFIKKREISK